MLAAARDGADVVVASRYVRGGSRRGLEGAVRHLVSRAAGAVARALFSEARASSDPLSGFFLCRRRVIDGIEFRPVGFKILLELLVCVPGLRVRDVPLDFAARARGTSKASVRQGLLFLGHIRSLVFDVQGSARPWKFGLVGLSGLAILLPLVALLTTASAHVRAARRLPARLSAEPGVEHARSTAPGRSPTSATAWARAPPGTWSAPSSPAWRCSAPTRRLVAVGRHPGAGRAPAAALVAMLVNGVTNRAAVRRRPRLWSEVALSQGVQAALRPPGQPRSARPAPPCCRRRAHARRRSLPGCSSASSSSGAACIFTEAAGHRAQRRSNIEVSSTLLVPVVDGDTVAAVLVCERRDPHAVRRRAARRRDDAPRWRSPGSSPPTAARPRPPRRRGGRRPQSVDLPAGALVGDHARVLRRLLLPALLAVALLTGFAAPTVSRAGCSGSARSSRSTGRSRPWRARSTRASRSPATWSTWTAASAGCRCSWTRASSTTRRPPRPRCRASAATEFLSCLARTRRRSPCPRARRRPPPGSPTGRRARWPTASPAARSPTSSGSAPAAPTSAPTRRRSRPPSSRRASGSPPATHARLGGARGRRLRPLRRRQRGASPRTPRG